MVPPDHPPTESGPRTSVGARPHVLEEGAAVAADDVDGAGGVDHGRVPRSRSPRRAGRAARPGDTCGRRARARPVAPNATTRARPQRAARAELLIPHVAQRDGMAHAAARRMRTQFDHTHAAQL